MTREELIRYARGQRPAELLLRNGQVVNVLSGEILRRDVALAGSLIVGIGDYEAEHEIDLEGAYLAPGFVDAHVHIESSLLRPSEFGRAVVPRGTTTVVTDPHEIANVLGLEGIRYMLDDSEGGPLGVFVMASSCVPATSMETSGAELDAEQLALLASHPRVLGLAEVMNFPGVLAGDSGLLAKLRIFDGRVIDGHCPGLGGRDLAAYAAAGIHSDHECTTVEEAREKLRAGMMVLIREATNAHNLRDLLPLVTAANHHRICFCTDDRQPADLLDEGHIDHMVRVAIGEGVDPVVALRMASWNAADHYRLRDRGAITPGRRADLVAFRELSEPRPHLVLCGGSVVARDGGMLAESGELPAPTPPPSMNIAWDEVDLRLPARGRRLRVIGLIRDQLITEHLVQHAALRDGEAVADIQRDLLKIAVIERHRASGSTGIGFVHGVGLKSGALASSVAHDHHNLVVVGADDQSMLTAARRCAELGGGMVAAEGSTVAAELALPIAGLMTDRDIGPVRADLDRLLTAARAMGTPLHDPFMAISFLALEVIPRLKITDLGLVDVDAFEPVPLWTD